MAATMRDGVLEDRWQPVFRHSAGRLGSQFLTAIRSERRLLAWQTLDPRRLSMPPKDFGAPGEWIEVGPGAALIAHAPAEWVADAGEAMLRSFTLGRVLVDGTSTPIFALMKLDGMEPTRGARLTARFAADEGADGQRPDFWFEPEPAARGAYA